MENKVTPRLWYAPKGRLRPGGPAAGRIYPRRGQGVVTVRHRIYRIWWVDLVTYSAVLDR